MVVDLEKRLVELVVGLAVSSLSRFGVVEVILKVLDLFRLKVRTASLTGPLILTGFNGLMLILDAKPRLNTDLDEDLAVVGLESAAMVCSFLTTGGVGCCLTLTAVPGLSCSVAVDAVPGLDAAVPGLVAAMPGRDDDIVPMSVGLPDAAVPGRLLVAVDGRLLDAVPGLGGSFGGTGGGISSESASFLLSSASELPNVALPPLLADAAASIVI